MATEVAGTVQVRIPSGLLFRTGNERSVTVSGRTVRQVIDALEEKYPGIRFNLVHETGELRPYVNVFVKGESVRYLEGMETAVEPGTTVHIIHSVAGG